MLEYYHTQEMVKCNIFPLTMTRAAIMSFETLPDGSIHSWKDLYDAFDAPYFKRIFEDTSLRLLEVKNLECHV